MGAGCGCANCARERTAYARSSELLRPHCANGVGCASAEKVESELLEFRPVNFGKLDLQQNLTVVRRLHQQRTHDLWRVDGRHFVQIFGCLSIRNTAAQDQSATVSLDLDLLVGIGMLDGGPQTGHIQVHNHVKHLRTAGLIPQNQTTGAGSPALYHDFSS